MSCLLKRVWFLLVTVFIPLQLQAFSCVMTVAKDDCWLDYDVMVTIATVDTHQKVADVVVHKGEPWGRTVFTCEPNQKLMYYATFQPVIWQADAGKIYRSQNFWALPSAVSPGDTAWQIQVCYAHDFAQTPLPPQSKGNCSCDFSKIPPVKVE